MEGELVSPLLMAPVHIDPSCLHPDLLTEVQHVVIAREQLLLHLNQIIGRGERCSNTTQRNATQRRVYWSINDNNHIELFPNYLFCLILYSS